jgi:hypothetical protein
MTIDYCLRQSGDHSKVEPPGPVPNPEVKHFCADGSWAIGPVRVGRRQFICPLQANACSGLFFVPRWRERVPATLKKEKGKKEKVINAELGLGAPRWACFFLSESVSLNLWMR